MTQTDALPGTEPPTAWRAVALAVLLCVVSAAFQTLTLSRHLNNIYDEGLILLGAQRVLDGEVPYRDFWGMYGPGQFYAVAGLFKLTASTVLIEQMWDIAIRAGLTTVVYLWARKVGAAVYAWAAWLVAVVALAGFGGHGFPVFHALLFGLLSGWLVLGAIQVPRPAARLCVAGACAGVAALFRHDMGFYVVLADALFLAWAVSNEDHPDRLVRLLHMLLALALGAALIVGPVAAWLLSQMPASDIWFNLFVVPATIYPRVRALPFPEWPDPAAILPGATPVQVEAFNNAVVVYFPLLVVPLALIYVAWTSRSAMTATAEQRLQRLGILMLALLTLLLSVKGSVRISAIHAIHAAVPAAVLCFALLARVGRIGPLARAGAFVLGAIVAVALLAKPARIVLATIKDNGSTLRALRAEMGLRLGIAHLCAPQPGLDRARCFLPRPDDATIARLIQSRTQPGEPVYVGPARHDRIFINNLVLQYLMARPPATKWHESHPGIQTTAPIQALMIEEFKARNVRYLVLSAEWENVRETNDSAVSSCVTLLDDYIKANFEETEKFGAVSIWRRRGS